MGGAFGRLAARGGRWARWAGLLVVAAAWAVARPAVALELVALQVDGLGRVLLLRDCEPAADHPCRPQETRFYRGDAERVDRALRSARYAEVWLNSGGGDSREGPLVGRVLRRHGMAVRVHAGHRCASACTVAFLGGVLRSVDEGGQYLVHSRSGAMQVGDDELNRMLAAPASELERYVLAQREANRAFVAERLIYLQTMLGGRPDTAAYAQVMRQGLDTPPPYLGSPAFERQVAGIKVERAPAVHSAMLQLERDSFDEALAHVAPHLDRLGPRARAAHRMMTAMFATSIVRVSTLTPETLLELGFVTPALPR